MKEVVRAIIVNENGQVLMGERVRGLDIGGYSLLGGKADIGELLPDAIEREIGEELPGVKFTPIKEAAVMEYSIDPDDKCNVTYYFGTVNNKPTLDMPVKTDEIGGLIFVGPEDIDNEGIPFAFDHRDRLRDFFNSPLYSQIKDYNK